MDAEEFLKLKMTGIFSGLKLANLYLNEGRNDYV